MTKKRMTGSELVEATPAQVGPAPAELVEGNPAAANGALVNWHGGPGRLIVPAGSGPDKWVTSYPRDTDAHRAALLNAESSCDCYLDRGCGDIQFELAHYVAIWRQTADINGEVSEHPWLVLIDPQGKTLGTSSPIVAHRVARICDTFPGFPGGRTVWVSVRWNNGRRAKGPYHDLRVLTSVPIKVD